MPTIADLSQTGSVSQGDEVALFVPGQGTRKATIEQVAECVLQAIEGAPNDTVYSLNAGTVAALPAAPGGSVWAQVTLDAPAAALTVILPGADDRANGQEALFTCTQEVSALTVNGNGAFLSGAPASIGPTTPFRMKFDLITSTWYLIG